MMSQHEATVRWLEHGLMLAERQAEDLSAGIGLLAQGVLHTRIRPRTTSGPSLITFSVTGCNGMSLSPASVSITDSASTTQTGNATGTFTVTPPGNYTWTVTSTRFTAVTGTVVRSGHGNVHHNVAMSPTSSFKCFNWEPGGGIGTHSCAKPLPLILRLGGPVTFGVGFVNLTYGTTPIPGWHATRVMDIPLCGACPAVTGLTIRYELTPDYRTDGILRVYFPTKAGGCPGTPQVAEEVEYFDITGGGFACPTSFTATLPLNNTASAKKIYCGGSRTATLSE